MEDKTLNVQDLIQALQTVGGAQQRRVMTVSDHATPFGCCNFFDQCGDGDLMSLFYDARLPLLDWMGFNVTDKCYRVIEFIDWIRPAYEGQTATGAYLCDPCADPHGIEYGACHISVEDFGRLGRLGPVRDIYIPKRYCETSPLYRLDGSRVDDERVWDMHFITGQLIADVSKMLITGNAGTCGQFDGLERWVRTGYDCNSLDSIIIDWNGNPFSGGVGITWNGAAVGVGHDFIEVLLAAFRRIRDQIHERVKAFFRDRAAAAR